MTTTFVWMTTRPNPIRPAHTHGADQGQVGWKLHAIPMTREDDTIKGEAKRRPAMCGTRPRHGWGSDLFIDAECTRCAAVMAKREAKGETFEDLDDILSAERKARECPACGRDPLGMLECNIPDEDCAMLKKGK